MLTPRVAAVFLAITTSATAAHDVHAQDERASRWNAPQWMGDVAFAGVNALASGVGAGVIRMVRGGRFGDGFTRGALGGVVHYTGMRVSAQRFTGAGLLGRQISATGISMTRNAGEGRGTFDQLYLPFGPVSLYVRLDDGIAVRPKVDLATLATIAWATTEQRLTFDLGESLSAGAPVFDADHYNLVTGSNPVGGLVAHGVIVMSHHATPDTRSRTLAHERVHVAQRDWLFQVWGEPVESWIAQQIPGVSSVHRYVDINLLATGAQSLVYAMFGVASQDRLHELEADFLGRR